jgi:ABC-type lipoprotein release transport system permease subunit
MDAVRLRFAAEFRSRWRVWLALALLLGLSAGAVAAVAAGARRTNSAARRFAHENRAYDAFVGNFSDESAPNVDPAVIAKYPMVAATAPLFAGYASINGEDVVLLVPRDDRYGTVVNRRKVIEGRLPRRDAADEFTLDYDLAHRLHLHAGDTFPFTPYGDDGPAVQAGLPKTAHLVGVIAQPNHLALPPPTNESLEGSPALYDAIKDTLRRGPDATMVRLERGTRDLDAFEKKLGATQGNRGNVSSGESKSETLRKSNRLQAVTLWLVAGLLGLAVALVVSQVLVRSAASDAGDGATLSALGLMAGQRRSLAVLRGAFVGLMASVVAILTAIVASPLFPTGLARISEPDTGFAIDAVVFLVTIPLVVLFGITSFLVGNAFARTSSTVRVRSSRVLGTGVASALPLAVHSGVGFAFRRDRLPVRVGIAAVAVGVIALTGAFTFGASLGHLLDTPTLYGWRWDSATTNYGSYDPKAGGHDPAEVADDIGAIPGVEGVAMGNSGLRLTVNGKRVGGVMLDATKGNPDDVLPPITEGSPPLRAGEIALGKNTLHDVHAHVGDRVHVTVEGSDAGTMKVVGRVVLPRVQNSNVELGDGALLPDRPLVEAFGIESGPNFPIASEVYLQLDPDASPKSVRAQLTKIIGRNNSIDRAEPADLVNFGRVKRMPLVLGGLLALLAAATLTHALVSAVRRERHDLATLKAVGMTRGQVTRTVAAQATALGLAALVVGIPLGVLLGRVSWSMYADRLGVVEVQVLPFLLLAAVLVVGLVIANLVAIVPARSASRTSAALALRSE